MNPLIFGTEFFYTLIIIIFCFMIYYKTRHLYVLTKYKGIKFFRNAFLFFGLAYLTRFIAHLIQLSLITFDFIIPRRMFFPLLIIPVGYFSTMAIFYLAYSTVWKEIKHEHFITVSSITAAIVSVVAFVSNSVLLLTMLQLFLLIFTIIMSTVKHNKNKKYSQIILLYSALSLFWLLNLFVLTPGRFLPLGTRLTFQTLSLIVFIIIYYKVEKHTK